MPPTQRKPWWLSLRFWIPIIAVLIAAVVTVILPLVLRKEPADFGLYADPLQKTVAYGGVTHATIVTEKIANYKHQIALSAGKLPPGIVVTFNPQTGKPNPIFTSVMTIKAAADAQLGDYTLAVVGRGADDKDHTCSVILTVVQPSPPVAQTGSWPIYVSDIFSPSGWMGDFQDLLLDDACVNNPHTESTCLKISYSTKRTQGNNWAGIYWQYPDKNWGDNADGRNLIGASKLSFWAKGEMGGEKAEFKVGGITGKFPDSIQPPVSAGVIILSSF